MSNPIVKRYCLQIEGVLASPMLAGSGKDEVTDSDVIRDAYGWPYAPGSSLAGAFANYLRQCHGAEENVIQRLFGSATGFKSRLNCYHMELGDRRQVKVARRDGVKLDEYKTAVDKAKYIVETVEAGTPFKMRLEWVLRQQNVSRGFNDGAQGAASDEEKEAELLHVLIDGMADGTLTFGAKGNRGFGRLQVDKVQMIRFEHTPERIEDSQRWLVWNWDSYTHSMPWQPRESELLSGRGERTRSQVSGWHELRVELAVRQTLMIRQYASESSDYEQLRNGAGTAVIPGTSWAGALRRHIHRLMQETGLNSEVAKQKAELLFGTWLEGDASQRAKMTASLLRVEESVVCGGASLPVSRTAIDRFTGGVKSGALFTTQPWTGGETALVLRWHERDAAGRVPTDALCGLLLWAVRDLQDGLMPIGGETAIGRGVLAEHGAVLINGKPIESDAELHYGRAAVQWLQQEEDTDEHADISNL